MLVVVKNLPYSPEHNRNVHIYSHTNDSTFLTFHIFSLNEWTLGRNERERLSSVLKITASKHDTDMRSGPAVFSRCIITLATRN